MSVKFSKSFIYGQIIFWSIAAIAAVVIVVIQAFKEIERSPYKKNIETYLEKPQGILPDKKSAPKDSIAITGKLIIVNLDKKAIDLAFNDLPKELKPENPDQVKTVLWVQCNRVQTNSNYSDGSPAYSNDCNLTFIDLTSKKYLWSDKVISKPPMSKRRGSNSDVSDPTSDILFYLGNIPHRD